MYIIKNNYQKETIIKNSRFICLLYKINSIDDINTYLKNAKELFPQATHYCYAYIINNNQKFSDDGEPSKTAGYPILKILENNELDNTLAIVVRYFGGIKLGANGLVRAYANSVNDAIKEVGIKELIDGYNVNIIFNYDMVKTVDYLLKDAEILKKDFNDKITYNVNISNIKVLEDNNLTFEIKKEIKIEK